MLGYENIPAYWNQGLKEAESIDLKYTTMSASFPTRFPTRRIELFWKYGLDKKKHTLTIKVL